MSKNQLFLYSMDCLTSLNILFFHSSVNKLKEKKIVTTLSEVKAKY